MDFEMSSTSARTIYNLLIGLVAPRPIALVTSRNEGGGINAAPFSSYNYLCTDPPVIGMGVTNRPDNKAMPKDTARNIRREGEFVVNVVSEDILQQMNVCATDFPPEISEVEMAGLHLEASKVVSVPRLAEAHAALECRELQTIEIGRSRIVLGQVIAMYIEDRFIDSAGPYVKADELHAVGRMNGQGAYVRTRDAIVQVPRIPYAEWQKGRRE